MKLISWFTAHILEQHGKRLNNDTETNVSEILSPADEARFALSQTGFSIANSICDVKTGYSSCQLRRFQRIRAFVFLKVDDGRTNP